MLKQHDFPGMSPLEAADSLFARPGEISMDPTRQENAKDNEKLGEMERSLHRVRVPGFVSEDDVGLGDLIKSATSAIGIKPCSGCERRARALNRWISFHRLPIIG
jgi:hypothetical protein